MKKENKKPLVDVVENKETVESLISEYEAVAEKCADFKERASYYIFIEDLKRIKQIPVTVSNNYLDAEVIATEYANQYPEKDYHDLQQAVIYGIIKGANRTQSQSIEGIVGFVLEWVVEKTPQKWVAGQLISSATKHDILSLKSDIIKELKNGK